MTSEELAQKIVDEAHSTRWGTEVRQFVAKVVGQSGVPVKVPGSQVAQLFIQEAGDAEDKGA